MKVLFLGLLMTTSLAFNTLFLNYTISEDYSIKFETKKAVGTFRGLTGTVVFDPDDLANSVMDVQVEVSTIQTGNTTKDKHARGKKWFNAEMYPFIKFTSQRIEPGTDLYTVIGDLTIKDVTTEVVLPFTSEKTENGWLLEGELLVNRTAFNIKGSAMGFAVGKEVKVNIRVPVEETE